LTTKRCEVRKKDAASSKQMILQFVTMVLPLMKTFLAFFRSAEGKARLAVLLLAYSTLVQTNSSAATVTWSGAGGDELWSNPANWSGGALPTSLDDVVIDVPGEVTVRMNVPSATVRSLQCVESFRIEAGSFEVTEGMSVIDGAFSMTANQQLAVSGTNTTFTVNGAVTNVLGYISAINGGVIDLPTARELHPVSGGTWLNLRASGSGSAINLTNLTNIIINFYGVTADAVGGGLIDMRRLRPPDRGFGAGADGAGSLFDLSGFDGVWRGGGAVSAGNGGAVLIPNVTALEGVSLSLTGDGQVIAPQLRSFTGASITLDTRTNGLPGLTNFSGSIFASNSRLDWTNFTVLQATNADLRITAHNNSVIDLSSVTNVAMNPSYRFELTAQDGGRIDLRNLRQPDGAITVTTRLGGGLVDLSGFTGLWEGKNSTVRADGGGAVLIPNVTAMDKVSLTVSQDSFVPMEQLRSCTGVTFTLYGRTNSLAGLTNFTGYLVVYDTRLDLTNLTTLYVTNNSMYLHADRGGFIDLSHVTNVIGYSGVSVFAFRGGRIDLSGLRVPEGQFSAGAYDTGSFIDLSGFTGTWRGSGGVTAETGGTVLMPNVTALDGVSLSVNGDANIDLAQLNSITAGNVTLRKRTNDLTGLTNFTGQLTAIDSRVYLTNLTVLYVTNHTTIQAEQGSLIDFSRITNVVRGGLSRVLDLNAHNGGIDLSGLVVPDSGLLRVNANGPNGLVDFSGLSGLWDATDSVSLNASSGGTVAIPIISETRGVSFTLSGDAKVPVAQLQSFREGSIRLTTQTNVFAGLTNFTGTVDSSYQGRAEFPGLTQLNATNYGVSFSADGGGVVDLSQVTNAVVEPQGFRNLSLSVSSGGRIEISNLETIVAGNVHVTASGANAVVDLRGLTGFFSDNNGGRFSTSAGGVILLNSDAMLIAGVAFDLQGNPGGPVPPFLAPSQSLVLYGQPWRGYRIEARDPSVPGSSWSLYKRVPLTEALELIGPRPPKDVVLRVHAFIADPPEVDIRFAEPGFAETVLYGVPDRAYRLETTTSLNTGWENGPTRTMTNSFFIFPGAATTNDARFFRARQL
jgi:hypothetical protein